MPAVTAKLAASVKVCKPKEAMAIPLSSGSTTILFWQSHKFKLIGFGGIVIKRSSDNDTVEGNAMARSEYLFDSLIYQGCSLMIKCARCGKPNSNQLFSEVCMTRALWAHQWRSHPDILGVAKFLTISEQQYFASR